MSALPDEESASPIPTATPAADGGCVWVLYDAAAFEGIDLNGATWLDSDAVAHPLPDMLPTERLAAIADLERMAYRTPGGLGMVRRTRLYTALADIDAPASH